MERDEELPEAKQESAAKQERDAPETPPENG
jgi:hypothetical protein